MKTLLLALNVTLLATTAQAAVKCPEANIQMLYPNGEQLFIQLEGQPWHVLAEVTESDYEKKMARAMKAQKKDFKVQLTFPNGYDETCMTADNDVVAKRIKLIKD